MICGVALLLVAKTTGRIFVIKERNSKPEIGKVAGMISFPIETIEPGEDKVLTAQRAVSEEIDVNLGVSVDFFAEIELGNVHVEVALAECDEEFDTIPPDESVEFFGWLSIDELLSYPNIRLEVFPVLEALLLLKAGK